MTIFSFLKNIIDTNDRQVKSAKKVVLEINAFEPQMQKRSYPQMQKRVVEMRKELAKLVEQIPPEARTSLKRIEREKGIPEYETAIQDKLQEFLPEFYAMIKEVYSREVGIKHFDEQLIAGVMLAQGQKLTELKTGEGKTMVFQLPLLLYSLVGRGAHLVTVNDYLAKRDAEYAGFVASKLGISVGVIAPGQVSYRFITPDEVKVMKGEEAYKEVLEMGKPKLSGLKGTCLQACGKTEAYGCDVTYTINNELGFDYLRDNMAPSMAQMVQRELYFCVVDEADSILVDEARTPLIISGVPEESDTEKYARFASAVSGLDEARDYTIDHKTRSALFTEEGVARIEQILGVTNLWEDYSMVHHLENALKAKALFQRDDHYLVRDDEVLIVDSFTGRVLPGRRFSEGLHQAIEAKEGVKIQQESKTFATISFQNFFRLYKILAGGSGTIITEAEEFYKIYGLESVEIPTHRPVVRQDKHDSIFRDQTVKFAAVVREAQELHATGQPVLIGTRSIEHSEIVSRLLDEQQIAHTVLNAKYHEQEAHIVSKAGQKDAVTVATNMAGRGTDIPLGEGVADLGGLAVIGTERHEARRIDNQLRGRSGRQGDPGYTRFYVALDDQIMKVLGGDLLSRLVGRIMDDSAPIEMGLISRQIETAQKRVEWANFDERKRLVEYDDVMNKQREVFYSRRQKLLITADQALMGDKKEATLKAQADLELIIKDILLNELDYIVRSQYALDNKLDAQRLQNLVGHVLDLAADQDLAKAFSMSAGTISSTLADMLRGLNPEQALEKLTAGVLQVWQHKLQEFGADFAHVAKMVTLESMDKQWVDHLEMMTDIRSGIGLQGYAQKDPLVEYKNIAFKTFSELMDRIDSQIARRVLKLVRVQQVNLPGTQNLITNEAEITDILTGDRELPIPADLLTEVKTSQQKAERIQRQLQAASGRSAPVHVDQKVGRNDPCPCGSGQKYKKCGAINSAEHQKRMQGK